MLKCVHGSMSMVTTMTESEYHMLLDQINTIYWTADRSMHKSDWNTTLFHVLANNINEDDYE